MKRSLFWAVLAVLAVPSAAGLKQAAMRVPEGLVAVAPLEVVGHQVRTLNKPMSFGDYHAGAVKEGVEFAWSVEAFDVRGGSARKRYRFVLETPEDGRREVECRSRAIELWRDGWSIELTEAFTPRLVCGVHGDEGTLKLVLGSRAGIDLRGTVVEAEGKPAVLSIRSHHKLEGSPLRLEEPAGYLLERGGVTVAAVEVLNRGRVWISPDLDPESKATVAAVAGALLLYKPELTPQID